MPFDHYRACKRGRIDSKESIQKFPPHGSNFFAVQPSARKVIPIQELVERLRSEKTVDRPPAFIAFANSVEPHRETWQI